MTINTSTTRLGIFGLGVAGSLYYVLQYLTTPVIYWLTPEMNNPFIEQVFGRYEAVGMSIITPEVYFYLVLGFLAYAAGFMLMRMVPNVPSLFHQTWARERGLLWGVGLIGAGFALKTVKLVLGGMGVTGYFGTPDTEYSPYFTLLGNPVLGFMLWYNWLHLIGLAVLLITYFEASRSGPQRSLFFLAHGVLLIFFVTTLASGSRSITFSILFEYLVIRQFYRPLRIHHALATVIALALALFIVKNSVRELNLEVHGGEAAVSVSDAVTRAAADVGTFAGEAMARVSMAPFATTIIERTDEFYYGETFLEFFEQLKLPWMEKRGQPLPHMHGNEFGHFLGLIDESDQRTGIASSVVGDIYRNFGVPGIVIGLLLLGMLYKVLCVLCLNCKGPLGVLTYSFVWPQVLHGFESPLGILLATLVKMLAFALIVHLLISFPVKHAAAPRPAFRRN